MKKKGFTLVELLGVVAILAIVLGMTIIGYINVNNGMKKHYYEGVEESALMSATDYYTYNKNAMPTTFGEPSVISFKELVEQKFIEKVVDQKGLVCDLDNSYVKAYKDTYDKLKYYICLICNDYRSEDCDVKIDYSITVRPTLGVRQADNSITDTNKKYNEGNYTNQPVILHFETRSEAEEIILKDGLGNEVSKCTTTNDDGVRTCNIIVTGDGTYTYYGVAGDETSNENSIKIRVDEKKPNFNVLETVNGIDTDITNINGPRNIIIENKEAGSVNIKVSNILDNESGIKKIRYSFENKEKNDHYEAIDVSNTTFDINKNFNHGTYILKIETVDLAGNTKEFTMEYNISLLLEDVTELLCNDLTYNGLTQNLATPIEGITLKNNTGKNAGDYEVIAAASEGFVFASGETEQTLTCTIKRKIGSIEGTCRDLTYNGKNQTLATDGTNVVYENNTGKNAGIYHVTAKSDDNYMYSDESISKVLDCEIKQKDVNITPKANQKKTYGEADPTFAYNSDGFIEEETPTFKGSLSRIPGEDIGLYKITPGSLDLYSSASFDGNNYNLIINQNVDFAIESKEASGFNVTLSSSTFTYNGKEQRPSATIKDGSKTLVEGKDYDLLYNNNKNAGTGTVSINYKGNYSGLATKQFTINKKKLNIKARDFTKSYSADNPILTYTYSGQVSGETPAFTGVLSTTATKMSNVGTYDITKGSLTLKTENSFIESNYEMVFTKGILTINPKSITNLDIMLGNTSVEYNGSNITPEVAIKNGNINLVLNTDYNVSYSSNKDAGEATISIAGKGNYSGTVYKKFNIIKRKLEVKATNQEKTYGENNPSLTYTYSGQVSGETPGFTGALSTSGTKDSPVGTYDILQGTLDVINNGTFKASNYEISYIKAYLFIHKKNVSELTIGDIVGTYTYNGSPQTPTVSIKDVSKELTKDIDYKLEYQNNKNAGTATLNIIFQNNYDGTVSKNFTINKKLLTITANDAIKIYNSNNPVFTYSYYGEITGEVPNATGNLETIATKTSPVGTYDINQGTLTFNDSDSFLKDNYNYRYVKGTLTINPLFITSGLITYDIGNYTYDGSFKKPGVTVTYGSETLVEDVDYEVTYTNNKNAGTANINVKGIGNYGDDVDKTFVIAKKSLNVNADNKTKIYLEENPTFTYSYFGVVSGETPALSGLSETAATTTSPAGNYTINKGTIALKDNGAFKKDNYIMTYTPGILTIIPKTPSPDITLSATGYVYDGTDHKPIVIVKESTKTYVEDTDYTLVYTNFRNAGTAQVKVIFINNYTGEFVRNYTISKKTLTIKSKSVSRQYRTNNPGFGYTVTGLVSGETPNYYGHLTTNATISSKVGTYNIYCDSLQVSDTSTFLKDNYNVVHQTGTLTITQKRFTSLSPSYIISSYTYNGKPKTPIVRIKDGDYTLVENKDFTVTYNNNVNAGTAKITVTGKGNYTNGSYIKNFTIGKAILNVIGTDKEKIYQEENPELTYTYSGQVSGETPKFTGELSTTATNNSPVGVYDIDRNDLELTDNENFLASNYNIVYTKGYLTIKNKSSSSSTVTLSQTVYNYDGTEKRPTVTVKDGTDILELNTDYTLSYANNINAGTASVTVNYQGNYSGTITENFVIKPTLLTVTATDKSKYYRDSNPTLTYTYSGNIETPGFTGSLETSANDTSEIGNYSITKGTLALSNQGSFLASNYNMIFVQGTLTIEQKSASSLSYTLGTTTYTYDGTEKIPSVTIKDGSYTLVSDTDYELLYENNIDVGTGKVTVTGKGNYTDSKELTFTINKANDVLTINNDGTKTYDGTEVTPYVTAKSGSNITFKFYNGVTCSGTPLENAPTDVSSSNYSFIATSEGNNNYNSKSTDCTVTKINPRMGNSFTATLDEVSFVYDGTLHQPSITIIDGSKTLTNNTDYNLSYSNNKNVGEETAEAIVTFKGNYTGSLTRKFSITKRPMTIKADDVSKIFLQSNPTFTYTSTGNIETPGYTGSLEVEADNYSGAGLYDILQGTLEVIDNGEFKVDNYEVMYEPGIFTINPKSSSQLIINRVEETFVYDGLEKNITLIIEDPEYRVVDEETGVEGNYILELGSDYEIEYYDNVHAGTARYDINFIEDYYGSRENNSFVINKANDELTLQSSLAKEYDREALNPLISSLSGSQLTINYYNGTGCSTENKLSSAPINQGTYSIDASSLGNNDYNGSILECTEAVINRKDGSTFEVIISPSSYDYDGTEKIPNVTIKDGSYTLINNTEYTVTYSDNINAGTASVDISYKGNYSGVASKSYEINKISDEVTITNDGSKIYDGNVLTATATNISGTAITYAYYSGTECSSANKLTSAPKNAGTYSIVATSTGNDNYNSGSSICTIATISPKSGTEFEMTLSQDSYTYDGNEKKPVPIIRDGSLTLSEGVDYNVSYSNNVNVTTTALIQVGFNGNYKDTLSKYFEIVEAQDIVTLEPVVAQYTGSPIYANTARTLSNTTVTYTYYSGTGCKTENELSNVPIDIATYSVRATSAGNNNWKSGTTCVSHTIEPFYGIYPITLSQTVYTYDGTPKTPTVTIMDGSKTMIEGTDYTFVYNDNIDAGTASINVTYIGAYAGDGTGYKSFTIERAQSEIVCQNKDYNGANQIIASCPNGCKLDNPVYKQAGTYTITGTALNDNYIDPLPTECFIKKITPQMRIIPTSGSVVYNGTSSINVIVNSTPSIPGQLHVLGGGSNIELPFTVKEIFASSNDVSNQITYKGLSPTSTSDIITIRFYPDDHNNYNNVSKTYTVTSVQKAPATLTLSSISVTHKLAGSTTTIVGDTLIPNYSITPTGNDVIKSCGWYSNTTNSTNGGTLISSSCGSYVLTNNELNKYVYFKITTSPGTNYTSNQTATLIHPEPIRNTVNYYVRVYQQANASGSTSYTLYSTATYTGIIGSKITVSAPTSFANFNTPSGSITKTLSANAADNYFDFKYTRKCFGSACNTCNYGSKLGSCLYNNASTFGLWNSGLGADTARQNLRYTGNAPNNYICYGAKSGCSGNTLYRIVGVFTTSHQVRIISTNKYGTLRYRNATGDDTCKYNGSKIKAAADKKITDWYNEIIYGSTKYNALAVNRSVRNFCNGRIAAKSAADFLNQELGVGSTGKGPITAKAFPVFGSDIILASKNTGYTFYNHGYQIKANGWMESGDKELLIHAYNTARSNVLNGNLGMCHGADNAVDYNYYNGTKQNCGISGYFTTSTTAKYNHYWRLNLELNSSTLFCGGTGTSSDPFRISYSSC